MFPLERAPECLKFPSTTAGIGCIEYDSHDASFKEQPTPCDRLNGHIVHQGFMRRRICKQQYRDRGCWELPDQSWFQHHEDHLVELPGLPWCGVLFGARIREALRSGWCVQSGDGVLEACMPNPSRPQIASINGKGLRAQPRLAHEADHSRGRLPSHKATPGNSHLAIRVHLTLSINRSEPSLSLRNTS